MKKPVIILILVAVGWAWRTIRESKQEWRDDINKQYCKAELPAYKKLYYDSWDSKWHVSLKFPSFLTINRGLHAAHFSVWQHTFDDSCAAKRYAITGKITYP